MKHANAMMLKRILHKAKWTKDMPNAAKKKTLLAQGSLPFVMGCDLNSPPDCAAFELLMSQDIFDPDSVWYKPKEVEDKIALP